MRFHRLVSAFFSNQISKKMPTAETSDGVTPFIMSLSKQPRHAFEFDGDCFVGFVTKSATQQITKNIYPPN